MKILLYILILGIILCTFASSDKVLEQGLALRNIIFSVLVLILFFVISCKVSEEHVILISPIFWVYLALLLVNVLSLSRAITATEGLPEVGRILLSLIFIYAITVIENKDKLVKTLIIISLIIGMFGVYEYFTVSNSARVGFMSNRNLWSGAFLLLLPFCLYGLSKWRYLSITAGALLLFNIVTLMTRSVWVSLIVASIVTLVVFRKLPRPRTIIIAIIIVGACLYAAHQKRNLKGRLNTESMVMRYELWGKTLQMVRDFPLGVGAGNWKINIARYGNEYPGLTEAGEDVRGERWLLRPHNDGLWVLAEMGIVGFGLYVTIFVLSLYYAYQNRNVFMFFGILCYLGFACFSFPRERVFHSMIILVMISRVIPVRKIICLSSKLIYVSGVTVTVLLLMTTAIYTIKYKSEVMINKIIAARHKDWQEVINVIDGQYSRLATIDPIFATPVIFYRAEAYLYLGNLSQAFEDFKRAYTLSPYHIYVIENLASSYAKHGFIREAIEKYEKVLEICPSFVAAKNNLEYLRSKTGIFTN